MLSFGHSWEWKGLTITLGQKQKTQRVSINQEISIAKQTKQQKVFKQRLYWDIAGLKWKKASSMRQWVF